MKMFIKKFSAFILLIMFCFLTSCSDDEILNPEKEPSDPDPPQTNIRLVPQQYSSIQSAIDSASVNDTILVSPGRYYENINFIGKNIVVKSNGSPENTIIDGSQPTNPSYRSAVMFTTADDSITATLDGFTIVGGTGTTTSYNKCGGGIFVSDSKALIKNCFIKNNSAYRYGGGISTWSGGLAILYNCVISNNHSTYGGGGGAYGCFHLYNCTIVYNTSDYDFGNIYLASGSILKNTIVWFGSMGAYSNQAEINYCDIQGGWVTGVGNINSDPMFCNAQLGNFNLAANSPCIGAGENRTNIGALGVCGQEVSRFGYPLEIGNTWKYSYSYSSSHMGEWWYRRGIHFWSVADSTILSNDRVRFSIKSVNYDSTASNYDPTVRHIIDSLIFYIDAGVDIVVVRPPSYVTGIEDNIQGYFSGSDSIKIGGRTYTEQIGLTNMLHENLTNSFYREKQQLIEFNKVRK